MWQKDRKRIAIKIILLILTLALAAGLAYAVVQVREREAAQDAELLELYNRQQAEQQQARQASVEEVNAAYRADMAAVAEYLPGIVCWGDVLTAGTAGGVSYPAELQALINANLCDAYDFRSTVKNADDFNNKLNWEEYSLEIPVVNMGGGKESADTVLGRSGAVPYVVTKAFEIPGDCIAVPVAIASANGSPVAPLRESDRGVNAVTLSGVTGTLSLDLERSGAVPLYLFTRNEPGEPVSIPAGEPVITAVTGKYMDYLPVIFVGSFGGYNTPAELVEKIQALVDAHADSGRYIVIGTYCVPDVIYGAAPGNAANLAALESAMSQAFGEHYINLRKYLANDAMGDLGLKPTARESRNMTSGIVPASLLNQENRYELTPAAQKLLGKVIYDKMDQLGYFDEIKAELEIQEWEDDRHAAA